MTVRLDLSDVPEGLRELVAQVTSGNDVEFADGGRVVAKLVSFEEAARRRGFGMYKGQVWMADDFRRAAERRGTEGMGDAVRLLPDTHVLLWWMGGDTRLPAYVAALLIDSDNEVFISAVCIIELATKSSIGKLRLLGSVGEVYEDLRGRLRAGPLPVTIEHGARLADLPLHHRDPFDRLLVAQAQVESLSLVSADPR